MGSKAHALLEMILKVTINQTDSVGLWGMETVWLACGLPLWMPSEAQGLKVPECHIKSTGRMEHFKSRA